MLLKTEKINLKGNIFLAQVDNFTSYVIWCSMVWYGMIGMTIVLWYGMAWSVSSIYISGVRTSVIRSMRKVKPNETKMAAIDVQ